MALFDSAIFDSAIFDTGAVSTTTATPSGGWSPFKRHKRKEDEPDHDALRRETERLAELAWQQQEAERSEREHQHWLQQLDRLLAQAQAAATEQQIEQQARQIVAALLEDLESQAIAFARRRDDDEALTILLLH